MPGAGPPLTASCPPLLTAPLLTASSAPPPAPPAARRRHGHLGQAERKPVSLPCRSVYPSRGGGYRGLAGPGPALRGPPERDGERREAREGLCGAGLRFALGDAGARRAGGSARGEEEPQVTVSGSGRGSVTPGPPGWGPRTPGEGPERRCHRRPGSGTWPGPARQGTALAGVSGMSAPPPRACSGNAGRASPLCHPVPRPSLGVSVPAARGSVLRKKQVSPAELCLSKSATTLL